MMLDHMIMLTYELTRGLEYKRLVSSLPAQPFKSRQGGVNTNSRT